MLKFVSRNVIVLTLTLGFAPTAEPITLSPSQNRAKLALILQTTTIEREKLATAEGLCQEGFNLFQKGTKESLLQAIKKFQQALPLRNNIASSDLKASYSTTIEKYYQLKTKILTELQ